MYELRNDLTVA